MIPHQKVSDISNIGTFIKPQQAQTITSTWRNQHPKAIFSFLYGRHLFDKILAAPNCEGIRIFNGINDEGKQALVFIGTDAYEEPIFSYLSGFILIDDLIGDLGLPCPPRCDLFGDISQGYLWKQAADNSLDLSQTGKNISLQKARGMINAWQHQQPTAVYSFLFGRKKFEALLAVPDCAGIVVYNGINEENKQTLVILPVDAQGVNIMEYSLAIPEGLRLCEGPILEGGIAQHVTL